MAKEVKNRVSLDATRFERGVSKVKRGVKDMEKGLTIDFQKAVRGGARGLAMLAAGVTAAGAAIGLGVNKAVAMGTQLDHLANQTGMTVSSLRVLQQVFEDGGVGAGKVSAAISRMQRTIGEARNGNERYTESLRQLGIPLEELSAMSPEDQFTRIGDAIIAIEDPAMRATAAMNIFGRSGAEMMNTFGSARLDEAANSLGAQAEILEKNSVLFERVSTLMNRAGQKIGGFFIGIADKVVPIILPLLEQLDQLDLAEKGQQFGENLAVGLRAVIGFFQQGTIGEFVKLSLQEAGANFINFIAKGWVAIGLGLWESLKATGRAFIDLMIEGLKVAVVGMGPEMLRMFAKVFDNIPGMGGVADRVSDAAERMAEVRSGALAALREMGVGVSEAFNEGFARAEDFTLFDTGEMAEQRQALIDAALAAVPAVGERAAKLIQEGIDKAGFLIPSFDDETPGDAIRGARAPLTGGVSSLAAIGGGGGVGQMTGVEGLVDESRKQTNILTNIREGIGQVRDGISNLSNGGPQVAVLA